VEGRSKKDLETRILRCVYPEDDVESASPSECPDFVIRRRDGGAFGVEVTEIFRSEPAARLDRIPGYLGELVEGGDFRHKLDAADLHVTTATILDEDRKYAASIPGVIQRVPKPTELRGLLADTIKKKSVKLANYQSDLEFLDLVAIDRTDVFWGRPKGDFFATILDDSLETTLIASGFHEVYLVIRLDERLEYVPLLAAYVLSEMYMFSDVLQAVRGEGANPSDTDLELFAQFLRYRGLPAVLSHARATCEVMVNGASLREYEGGFGFRIGRHDTPAECSLPPLPEEEGWRLSADLVESFKRQFEHRKPRPPVSLEARSDTPRPHDGSHTITARLVPVDGVDAGLFPADDPPIRGSGRPSHSD